VTVPADTVAKFALLVVHVTLLLVALEGVTVAVRVPVAPTEVSVRVAGEMVMPVTGTVMVTVTAQVAVLPPSAVVAVIVALPAATAVTRPVVELTVATAVLLELQVTVLLVAFVGVIEAVSVEVWPTLVSERVVGETVTPVTATAVTVYVTETVFDATPDCAELMVTVAV
jgi:hypothetical protein